MDLALTTRVAGWHLDPSFTFHDEIWNDMYEETLNLTAQRVRLQLNEVFSEDPSTFISITAHSGTINGFFKAVGHQSFNVQTGGFVPVLVSIQPGPLFKCRAFQRGGV